MNPNLHQKEKEEFDPNDYTHMNALEFAKMTAHFLKNPVNLFAGR
jgi:hypothetical protein